MRDQAARAGSGHRMPSVAAHTGECPAMTHRTRAFIQVQLAGGMVVQKMGGVVGGLEGGGFGVTIRATEGRIDLGVADQAIGHLWKGSASDGVGFLQTAMAGFAGIPGVEHGADGAGGLEVIAVIDSGCEERRHAAHAQMEGVAEFVHRAPAQAASGLMTAGAQGGRREEIVLRAGALLRGGMAGDALELQREMNAVREGRGVEGGGKENERSARRVQA